MFKLDTYSIAIHAWTPEIRKKNTQLPGCKSVQLGFGNSAKTPIPYEIEILGVESLKFYDF